MKASTRRALALTELIVVLALFALLVALALPIIQDHRRHASIKADLSKLRLIGMASAMYADASQDRLFTFSWVPGQVPVTPNTQLALATASLDPNNGSSHSRAAVLQQLDLVTHAFKDERIPPTAATAPPNHTPYPFFNHLVLNRFMGGSLPSDLFISAADKQRTYWKNNLDEYLDNPAASPVRPPATSTTFVQLWRWPFSSSFVTGPSHYSNDIGDIGNFPLPQTTARGSNQSSWLMPTQPGVLGNRTLSQVAFPAQKAMMFDEYDRYNTNGRQYLAFLDSTTTINFYDGHVGRRLTADSNFGFDPNHPEIGAANPDQVAVAYTYIPIPWWDPGATATTVPVYFDQTRGGLTGIDFD